MLFTPAAQGKGETTNDLTISSRNIGADDQSTRNGRRRIGNQECLGRGLTVFAGVIQATVGVFQFFQGLAAVIKGGFYVVAPNNIYEFSVSSWGWIHLILGIVLAVTAAGSREVESGTAARLGKVISFDPCRASCAAPA